MAQQRRYCRVSEEGASSVCRSIFSRMRPARCALNSVSASDKVFSSREDSVWACNAVEASAKTNVSDDFSFCSFPISCNVCK